MGVYMGLRQRGTFRSALLAIQPTIAIRSATWATSLHDIPGIVCRKALFLLLCYDVLRGLRKGKRTSCVQQALCRCLCHSTKELYASESGPQGCSWVFPSLGASLWTRSLNLELWRKKWSSSSAWKIHRVDTMLHSKIWTSSVRSLPFRLPLGGVICGPGTKPNFSNSHNCSNYSVDCILTIMLASCCLNHNWEQIVYNISLLFPYIYTKSAIGVGA